MSSGIYKRTKPVWNKGKKCPNIGIALKGKKFTEEHKRNISNATRKLQNKICVICKKEFRPRIKNRKYCCKNCYKKREISKETRKKMSETHKDLFIGEKNPNWNGGITKNIEYQKLKNKEYRIKNHKKILFRNKLRKVKLRQKEIMGSHTFGEWENLKIQYNHTCPCCGKKEPEIKLTEDHIIPIIKGGSNNIENIQPLCGHCNSVKHIKIIKY